MEDNASQDGAFRSTFDSASEKGFHALLLQFAPRETWNCIFFSVMTLTSIYVAFSVLHRARRRSEQQHVGEQARQIVEQPVLREGDRIEQEPAPPYNYRPRRAQPPEAVQEAAQAQPAPQERRFGLRIGSGPDNQVAVLDTDVPSNAYELTLTKRHKSVVVACLKLIPAAK